MSDIKNQLIKLAYENPELRSDLLPVITKLATEDEVREVELVDGSKYTVTCHSPRLGEDQSESFLITHVKDEDGKLLHYESLPDDLQREIWSAVQDIRVDEVGGPF